MVVVVDKLDMVEVGQQVFLKISILCGSCDWIREKERDLELSLSLLWWNRSFSYSKVKHNYFMLKALGLLFVRRSARLINMKLLCSNLWLWNRWDSPLLPLVVNESGVHTLSFTHFGISWIWIVPKFWVSSTTTSVLYPYFLNNMKPRRTRCRMLVDMH